MKAASIRDLKKTLRELDHDDLFDACIRLAKHKVENKELLTYLLLKSGDEENYVDELCDEIDELLPNAGKIHKKTLRKIVRWMDKRIRYSGDKETEIKVRIHFCRRIIDKRITFGRCRVSANMYASQLKKIDIALEKLHPDLQFDYRYQLEGLDMPAAIRC